MRGFSRLVWRDHTFLLANAAEVTGRRLQLADVIIHPVRTTVAAATELAIRTLAELTGCVLVIVGVEGHGWLVQARGADNYVLVPPNRAARSFALGSAQSE
jgi:hypothetical protein